MATPPIDAEGQSTAELGAIIRTLITEGGDTLKALLRAAMASPILAAVLGLILTEVAATKLKLIGPDVKLTIEAIIGVMVGAEAAGTVLEALPFKFSAGSTIPALGPQSVVISEAPSIPHSTILPEHLQQITEQFPGRRLPGRELGARFTRAEAQAEIQRFLDNLPFRSDAAEIEGLIQDVRTRLKA